MNADVFHRLGVLLGVALALGWLLRWIGTVRRERRVRRRLARLLALEVRRERALGERRFGARNAVRRWLPVAGAVSGGWALVGGVAGVVVGLVAGVALWWWRLRRTAGGTAAEAVDTAEAARQLPLAADLLAACIAAGAGPVIAAQAVGEALAGPVGERLARGAAEVRLGGEPSEAWRKLASIPGAGPLAGLLERADESGVPASGPVARLAADTRAEWGRTATERARRAAVMVTAPVGLCFLPAFIAVGVLPVVMGLADGLLGGGGG
ncbi:type II secretion system F family protein [Streptomyces turgidiscabies]|uniref:Type II secretion system F domain protein n=1 Tax=Streptomyces turgidiscabies (strain Car8) TaxID=698760 RepID=L7F2A3_STRT8|nr:MULTISPECIES: type II secretion system F family protein [Streptomyces]ELP64730.1 type II secretion system F domain protein [Streptomyces turgidiscabies Car8]MDX3492664.1 type II secretion system F family protein [Streptomyces turgidiscabies]GAQ69041.1 bacterial type II secretion system protein F domain protein [Streptomyces turgidiscabies]